MPQRNATAVLLVRRVIAPNDQRSHAGPRTLRCNRDELPALADAFGSAFSLLLFAFEGSPAFDERLEPLLHRVVLNMPESASVLWLVGHDHDKLNQTETGLNVPRLAQKLRYPIDAVGISHDFLRRTLIRLHQFR